MIPYTIVVGVANPETLAPLMETACLMAKQFAGRIVATNVVPPPTGDSSGDARTDGLTQANQLLGEALDIAASYSIPCDGTVSLARQIHEGIIDIAVGRQAKVIVVGFSERQEPALAEHNFDRIIDALAAHSPCHLLVAKFRDGQRFDKVLVPVASQLNLQLTGDLVTTLHYQAAARIDFIHFASGTAEAERKAQDLSRSLADSGLKDCGTMTVQISPEPAQAIVETSHGYDVVVVGTPPLEALRRRLFGSVAEHITEHAACTTYLVRSRESL